MKRILIILFVGLLVPSIVALSAVYDRKVSSTSYGKGVGDGMYVDDSYYWPSSDTITPREAIYDRNAREFIFLEDTIQYPDTVVMRIVEK